MERNLIGVDLGICTIVRLWLCGEGVLRLDVDGIRLRCDVVGHDILLVGLICIENVSINRVP
jgi:hypothetical protein